MTQTIQSARIDELIQEHCPDGVDHRALAEVGAFTRGNGMQKADLKSEGHPAVHYGELHTVYGTSTRLTKSFVDAEFALKLRRALPGDLLIVTTSEDDEAVAKATAWLGETEVAVSGDALIFRHELNPTYMSYVFQTNDFRRQKQRFISGTKVRRISPKSLGEIRIPVPPLVVQEEIVRILDTFTQLEAELEAELEARKQQYEYYRHSFLAFDDSVVRVPLGDLATVGTGSHDTKDAVPEGKFAFYARGREPLRLDSYDFNETAIITAGDGVGVGKVFHYATGQYALHQRAYRVVPNARVQPRYLYHYLVTTFSRYLERNSVHASVTSLRRPMFLKFPVALPPVSEQQRIIRVLDHFDVLTTDLSVGLPAEIMARRQQYEFYRDLLLSFEELVS